jgi:isoquinoline 1-oxidoreductase beta subunit
MAECLHNPVMKRRHILVGGMGAAGALVVGWSIAPVRQRLSPATPLPTAPAEFAFNGWLRIGADGHVLVAMARSEMGQGAHTGLAMILADELDADWTRLSVEPSPIDPIYANVTTAVDALQFHPDDDSAVRHLVEHLTAKTVREIGLMMTGGSSSIKDLWLPMRQAGASARSMLVAAAAAAWAVPVAEISVDKGVLLHASGRRASFGELAASAARQPLPSAPVLKRPAAFGLIGQPLRRIEAAAKIDGSARFGIDALPPQGLYAGVAMCPTLGGRVASFDGSAASRLPGVRRVLAFEGRAGGSGGVAVIADRPHRALRAVGEVKVDWDAGAAAGLSSAESMRALSAALDGPQGYTYLERGDVDAALAAAARKVSADYTAPYLAHAALEPINCTVQVRDGAATVWVSTQVPDLARGVVAAVLGLPDERVEMHVEFLGGGFGRRLDVDFIAQAAEIARAVPGVPVQTLWSREQDITHDFYRPACAARLRAGLDAGGRLVAWSSHSASDAIVPAVMHRYRAGASAMPTLALGQNALAEAVSPWLHLPGISPDKTTAEGAFDQPYEFSDARVGHTTVASRVPIGFWRSVGHSHQAFFQESFIDEVAHAAGQDPVDFRARLLAKHPRHLQVLQRAAALAGWGRPVGAAPDGAAMARGVALHQSFGSVVAQVAEVSLSADRAIRVHRVCCAVDCGTPINPNLIRQQMDSAIVFGLSAALSGEITIEKGRVQQSNFHDVPVLRIGACPAIETEIIASTEHPQGVGEPGLPPIAPAVANAVFALTGQRLRSLPLRLA